MKALLDGLTTYLKTNLRNFAAIAVVTVVTVFFPTQAPVIKEVLVGVCAQVAEGLAGEEADAAVETVVAPVTEVK